ncbi:hypothetical protein GE09DRAFT_1063759 [Coniochaeta sp. 2T2.1]|nr:hypothetical protein GE09DRAFT_1063759 [Coniochaeta sp. 2T2.1]
MAESKPPNAGGRYTADDLLFLRASPLCVKPATLPPAEEWMGPPPETIRNQTKPALERTKSDASLLEPRRPGLDRTTSRSSANPEDIVLGPPRTSFASATSMRGNRLGDTDRTARDGEPQPQFQKFTFRNPRTIDPDNDNDRFKNDRTNNAFRRRDADQDSEGWSTVKPRKSFGTEGAERFHGRMGGSDRTTGREDRRFRDREERDGGDRRSRNTDQGLREKDSEESEASRWNGLNRTKPEPRVKENSEGAPLTQRERIDRQKSWRDRIPEEKPVDKHNDRPSDNRPNDRAYDRHFDNRRVERAPEWMDEPEEEKPGNKTQEDFQNFIDRMRKSNKKDAPVVEEPAAEVVQVEQKVVSIAGTETGPDKFFATYESAQTKTGKSSRFTSFFSATQEDTRGATGPPAVAPAPAPSNGANYAMNPPEPDQGEKDQFNALLQKLKTQAAPTPQPAQSYAPPSYSEQPQQSSTPAMTPGLVSRQTPGLPQGFPPGSQQANSALASPDPYQQYGRERREDPRLRGPPQQQSLQDMLSPRPMSRPSQASAPPRPGQNLEDLLAQRQQHAMGQGGSRIDQNIVPGSNPQAEFLMQLMQNHRAAPEPLRTEQLMARMPQPPKHINTPNIQEREPDYHRERAAPQQQPQLQPQRQMRPQGAPGFFDDQFHSPDNDNRPQQPTQILQRPPPPGLDHHNMQFQMGGAPQQMPRPMIPPPPGINIMNPRNGPPGPPAMFPPNFPQGAFPPPDNMVGPPGPGPRPNMQAPPGFFPPPLGLAGFMPPLPNMGGFQGPPDAGLPFGGPPFDGRNNMPPHGAGGAFRRQ